MGSEPRGLRSAFTVVTLLAGAFGAPLGAQVPDTLLIPDTVQVPDTLVADTLRRDALQDSLPPDTIFNNLPALGGDVPASWETGVWSWDRDAIMASGASTLAELVQEVPGVIVLLGGDYGTPLALSAFGTGGGGVRVIRDGFEVVALAGGVTDLQRVGLGGISRVRLDRSGGELTVEMWSHEYDEGRPFSLVEAGTGDLDTNVFRGSFADPTALGGSIGIALERVDTRGPAAEESGSRTGSWGRYQLHRGEGAGIGFDFRRMTSKTEVPDFAASVTRTDMMVRGRIRVIDGLVAEAFAGGSSHQVDDPREPYLREGGSRAQRGGRLGFARGGLWAEGGYRWFGGGLPANRIDVSGGYRRVGLGGVAGHFVRSGWGNRVAPSRGARAWVGPVAGVSLFGSWDSGTYGARTGPPQDADPPVPDADPTDPTDPTDPVVPPPDPGAPFLLTDRTTYRAGATLSAFGATVSGAGLRVENQAHLPLGLEVDRGAPVLAGAERNGFEVWGSLPTTIEGLRLEGSLQQWDNEGPYLPEQIYRGAFVYHRLRRETLEWWISLGVRGHDPMIVPVADDGTAAPGGLTPGTARVPFYQSWYGRVQVRIVGVRIFIGWENFTIRRNLQTYPDRVLPITRAFYGLRWTMWS